jgi:DNA-binding MarR family transcriptional regulator
MIDMIKAKVLEELKKQPEIDITDFRVKISRLRLNKSDTNEIIKDLKKKNIIELTRHGQLYGGIRIKLKKRL